MKKIVLASIICAMTCQTAQASGNAPLSGASEKTNEEIFIDTVRKNMQSIFNVLMSGETTFVEAVEKIASSTPEELDALLYSSSEREHPLDMNSDNAVVGTEPGFNTENNVVPTSGVLVPNPSLGGKGTLKASGLLGPEQKTTEETKVQPASADGSNLLGAGANSGQADFWKRGRNSTSGVNVKKQAAPSASNHESKSLATGANSGQADFWKRGRNSTSDVNVK